MDDCQDGRRIVRPPCTITNDIILTASKLNGQTVSPDLLRKMDAYWRAANYLSVRPDLSVDNPLLREPLALEHVKPRAAGALGHDAGAEFYLCAFESGDQGV